MDLSSETGLGEFLGRWGLAGLAAGFLSGGWVGRRLSAVSAEDLADLGVPRAVRGEVLASLRSAVAEELASTLDGWMTPLALAASGYLREENPRLRLWSACATVEMALRLIVIIGLAQMRHAHAGRLPRERLVRVFEHIRTPTLSHWRAMALETCKALDEDGAEDCRQLGAMLAPVARLLSDLVGQGGDTETASLLRLRNMLAHGSVTSSLARDLAECWRARIDDALGKLESLATLPLLARAADGQVLRASGEAGTMMVVPDIDQDAVGTRAGAAAIGLAGRILPLTPFVLRGVPRVGDVRGSREVPQIFLRRSEIVLEYMALGAEDAAFGQGDDEHLLDFERLFETPRAASERRFQIPGFERELRLDADQFLGRASELAALWGLATGPEQAGLYWLYGPPGIGKSILMARLMADLIDEAEERRARASGEAWLVLAYRFRTGHESCRASTFLAFLRERLSEVVIDRKTQTAIRGLDDFRAVVELLPEASRHMRVLVPLDGLDEIAAAEPNFLAVELAKLVGAGGLWLCAGRPERRLPEFMLRHGAKEVLPGGLGGMETTAIRAMILEKAGPLGRKLLAGDRDRGDGQGVVNAFVEAVAHKADGLPLYVRYVVGDILGNRLRFLDGREAEGLPPSLTAYYEELVQRCAVGDDHVLDTYALCLVTLAYEPLSEAAIADLLRRRLTLDGDADAHSTRVRVALSRLGGMLTRDLTPDGDAGFRIYHESLREHLQRAPDLAITRRDAIENVLVKGAIEPGDGPAAKYLYLHGIAHLLEASDGTRRRNGRSEAGALLADFVYVVQRLRVLSTSRRDAGIRRDWSLISRTAQKLSPHENQWARFWATDGERIDQLTTESARQLVELALEWSPQTIVGVAVDQYLEGRTSEREEAGKQPSAHLVQPALIPLKSARILDFDACRATMRHPYIEGCDFLDDGRIVSWSQDSFRIWNDYGVLERVLDIQTDRDAVLTLPWLVSRTQEDMGEPDRSNVRLTLASERLSILDNDIFKLNKQSRREYFKLAQREIWKSVIPDISRKIQLVLFDFFDHQVYLGGHVNKVVGLRKFSGNRFLSYDSTGLIKNWDLSGFDATSLSRVSSLRAWDDWTLLQFGFLQTDEILTIGDVPHGWEFQMWSSSGDPVGNPWFETEISYPIQLRDGRSIVVNEGRALIRKENGELEKQAKNIQHHLNCKKKPRKSRSTKLQERDIKAWIMLDSYQRQRKFQDFEPVRYERHNEILFFWAKWSQKLIIQNECSGKILNIHLSHKVDLVGKGFIYCRRYNRLLLYKYDIKQVKSAVNEFGISV